VSLADVRIETDRISGEVTITKSAVPPLPVTTKNAQPAAEQATAPDALPEELVPDALMFEKPVRRLTRVHARWAGALALAACTGLVVWNVVGDTSETVAMLTLKTADTVEATGTASARQPAELTARSAARSAAQPSAATAEEDNTAEDATLVANTEELGDDEDPAGDEPHLVRARQLCNEGHGLRLRGRLGLAEAKYLQALGLFPQYPRAIAGVVRVHLTRGDGAEAVRWAERLVAMQANRSNNQLLLGDAYALSGKASDARRHWRKSAAYGNNAARKRLKNDEPVLAKPIR
jgi:hypothetical protein